MKRRKFGTAMVGILLFATAGMWACGGKGQSANGQKSPQSGGEADGITTITANAKEEAGEIMTMTMITVAEEARISLIGSGTATIDWGDGSEPQTVEILYSKHDEVTSSISHTFPGRTKIPRQITISGENITGLDCFRNQLTALDVSRNTALTYLNCGMGSLTELDVSQNTALTYLDCAHGELTALDVSKNTALTYLDCRGNKLTALDISKNTALKELNCDSNQLTVLSAKTNTALESLSCADNQLTAEAINALFSSLHFSTRHDKNFEITVDIGLNPGSADCDPNIAKTKEWKVAGYGIVEQATEYNVEFQGDSEE